MDQAQIRPVSGISHTGFRPSTGRAGSAYYGRRYLGQVAPRWACGNLRYSSSIQLLKSADDAGLKIARRCNHERIF
jgi:hypothetical protein